MKTAKELADKIRRLGGLSDDDTDDVLPMLDRLAAIEAAVPGEVGDIAQAHQADVEFFTIDQPREQVAALHRCRGSLLAIVAKQGGEIERLKGCLVDRGVLLSDLRRERADKEALAEGVRLYRSLTSTCDHEEEYGARCEAWEEQHGQLVPSSDALPA